MTDSSEYRDNVVPLTSSFGERPGVGGFLPPAGGGGIEARLARVESDMAYAQRDLAEIKMGQKEILVSLHRLEALSGRFDERLKILPSKGFIVTSVAIALAVLAALITFGGQIRSLTTADVKSNPPTVN